METAIRGEDAAVTEPILEAYPVDDVSARRGESPVTPVSAPGGDPRALAEVEKLLEKEPTSFGFFQAVRLLQQLRPNRKPVGHFVDPAQEVVRFRVQPAIHFPPSEIHELDLPETGSAKMSVNFMGLTGPQGLLPHHYSLLISERRRVRDHAIGDFFDLFHHRILSLFYRAWEKFRFSVGYERGGDDGLSVHLRDFVGLGVAGSQPNLPFPQDALLYYTGLFALQPRGAEALQQILFDVLDVPTEVEQFVGHWYPLAKVDQCAVGGDEGVSNQLGIGAVAGDEIWDAQTCVRIKLGPLTRAEYDALLPGGKAHENLRALARFFCHDQFELELQLILARDEVPGFVLGSEEGPQQPLGWCTWVNTRQFTRDADETILSL
jgi:type VI secretion system protein ImpH